jgi:hypothetical protein
MSSIDPLTSLIASVAADPLIALIASVAAVILSVFCALLALRQQRRLASMQTQLDNLSAATRSLERDYEHLWLRSLRSRKARKASRPSSDVVEEKMTAPALPNEKHFEEYLVAPRTSPK